MHARILTVFAATALLATACGGSSEGGDASTSEAAAGPDPATTKCSEFQTLDEQAQSDLVAAALEAKGEPAGSDTMLPMVVGLCDQLPDATVSEVLAGPAVATTSAVPMPPESAATESSAAPTP